MKRLFISALLFSAALFSQTTNVIVQPMCSFNFDFTATASQGTFNNKQIGCVFWSFTYANTGFSALSIVLEGAPDSSGAPGTWITLPGTILNTGATNPQTSITGGFTVIQVDPVNDAAWIRITLSSKTGSGRILGRVQGDKTAAVIGGGSGCAGTAATPCIVAGPDAPGEPATKDPVQVAGDDGTDVRRILTDTSGRTRVSTDASAGATLPLQSCNASAVFTSSGTGRTQIVAASGSNKVRICYLDFTVDTVGNSVNFQLDYGTGAACVTSPIQLTSLLSNVLAYSNPFDGPQGVPTTPASQAVCFNQTSNVALHGMVIYAYTSY